MSTRRRSESRPSPARRSARYGLLLALASAGFLRAGEPAADLLRVELDLRPDFARGTLAETAVLEFANPALVSRFDFGLSNAFTEVEVSERVSPVRVERGSGAITVHLERPASEVRLTFELAGTAGRSGDERRDVLTSDDLFLLWSDRFYPMLFEDWSDFRIAVTLPPGFRALAPGRLRGRRDTAGGVVWEFETTRPVRLVSVFADRRWIEREHGQGALRIRTLLHPESAALADAVAAASADVLAFYRDLHGGDAFEDFSFVTLEGIYARRAFPGFVGYSPAYLAREMERTGHDAHETALLWWFYTFAGSGPGSFQWTEGLGDYAEILYDEARDKPIPAIFERFRSEYLATPVEQDVAISELSGATPQKLVHGRYPWLMHVLRFVVGDEAFFRAWRRLATSFRYRTFTLDELVATLEAGTGRSLGWWRTEWLERAGVPEIVYRAEVARAPNRATVSLRVEQRGNLYALPLEIGFETSSGLRIERVEMAAEHRSDFVFELPEAPRRVVLDPRRWLLARVIEAPDGSAPVAR